MATKTTNYNLIKPAYDEDADIQVINNNMDVIDAKMKEIEEASGSGATITVDAELNIESTNPVQNKVISSKINELSSNLEKNTIGSIVNLTTDKYIIPKDGYIYVSCTTNASIGSTFINVGIYDAKDIQICALSAISNGTYSSSDTLFVKKGMSARILNDYGSTYARFIPLE